MSNYTQRVLDDLKSRNSHEPEFIQAATEILHTLQPVIDKHPEYEKAGLLEQGPGEVKIINSSPDPAMIRLSYERLAQGR